MLHEQSVELTLREVVGLEDFVVVLKERPTTANLLILYCSIHPHPSSLAQSKLKQIHGDMST
jgi:hypothetical protein